MDISFESNIREWTAWMTDLERNQIPFATSLALTNTAKDGRAAIEERILLAFDNPTPFTKRAVAYQPANKSELLARVFIKDIQAGYLEIEELGGTRQPRKRAIPIPVDQRRNQYGSLPKGTVKRLLARKDTFSGRVKGVGGIWQRTKRGPKLLIAWANQARYQPRFRFNDTVKEAVLARFPQRFEEALVRALATAR